MPEPLLPTRRLSPHARRPFLWTCLGGALTLAAVALPSGVGAATPGVPVTLPDSQEVAGVVFLVGDAGEADVTTSPLLTRLRNEVERWSGAVGGDSSVAVLFLGDNVYPSGIHDPGEGAFTRDTARLAAQVWTVGGPVARTAGTRGVFVPGNHDWGNLQGEAGLARLRNMEGLLASMAERGPHVSLRPRAGRPGPSVVDVGPARIAVLDTEWWLQSGPGEARDAAMDSLGAVLLSAGSRPVIVAAHHPLVSAGLHGGQGGIVASLLRRAGRDVQDLDSAPYEALRRDLSSVFRQFDRPLVYAAGHDHSLQVLRTAGPGQPGWTLVSGAGSKLTGTGEADGLVWAGDRPGFMRLEVRRDGAVVLSVESPREGAARCRGDDAQACVQREAAAFETVYTSRLR